MKVERTEEPRGFRLIGEIDLSNVQALSEVLDAAAAEGGDLVLDLSELSFIDSTGIQVLVKASQDLLDRGRLLLSEPGDAVRRVFEIVGFDRLQNVQILDRPEERQGASGTARGGDSTVPGSSLGPP